MDFTTEELKSRVVARQKELEARLAELKADALGRASDEMVRVKEKLEQLQQNVRGGWEDMSERTAEKLNELLQRS